MRKKVFIFFSTLALGTVFGQDIHFSQYYMGPQLINPAGFGALNSFEAGLQYKGQWNSFTNGYTSMAAFVNKSFRKEANVNTSKAYLSAGLNVVYDKAGSTSLTHFKAELPVNVTKRISSSSFLTAGLYIGYGQLAANAGSFTWGNQFDGSSYNSSLSSNEATVGQTHSYLDCGVGLSHVAVKKGVEQNLPLNVFGFSVSHLNQPNYSLYGSGGALGMRVNFYDYCNLYLANSPLSIVPSVLVQYQSKAYELVLGAALKRMFRDANDPKKTKSASVGVLYRMSDVCALNCMLEMNNFNFGINYDFNVSKLITSSRSFGGAELSLKMVNPFQYSYKNSKLLEKKI